MVGYVWPVGTTDEKGWEAGDPINISSDVINSDITVFTPYDDPFNNNQNLFRLDSYNGVDYYYLNNFPRVRTNTAGPVWDASVIGSSSITVTTDSSGQFTINDIGTWLPLSSITAVSLFTSNDWYDIEVDDNGSVSAAFVIYYPKSDLLFYQSASDSSFRPLADHKIILYSSQPNTSLGIPIVAASPSSFVDLNYGFVVPNSSSSWFNGYENKQIDILFGADVSNTEVQLTFGYTKVIYRISSGTISLSCYDNGSLYYYDTLGENSVYDKVLLSLDYDMKTISLSGLKGMSSYLGDYRGAIRQTITAEWETPQIFRSFDIVRSGSLISWYVPQTLSGVSSTPGSHNYYLNMRDYDPTGALQINLRSVQIHSDRFDIVVNSTVYNGTIVGNMLTIETDGEDLKVPINNLLVGLIENKVYLNGYIIADPGSFISSAQLRFYDDWLMSVYLYHMEEIDITGYTWMPGSFGLDAVGFCSVGLITSFGSALGLGLYGRRSGVRLGLVVMTALFCAAAYLIFMMNGGI